MGREDDLLLINFMTGARDVVGAQERRLSNTMNPFCSGSSSMLSQLVVSLMDSGTQSADGDMWKGRAIVFVESLMKILVYMRDKGKILLDANTIRNYFTLERLEAIVMDKMFPRNNQEPVSLVDVPDVVMEPVTNYLINLPGYDRSRKGKQGSQVLEQHGFITMQLTRVFGSLADTYGHIMRVNLAEVDLKDVVLNRRILVVLLPALEKAPEELASLGKVIVASLKAMMAAGLGDTVEGTYREVVTRKPTVSPTSFMCILDEYGYYAVKGFAVVPAQARSLGFSVIFAGQDLPAFQKASKEEAMSIGANTNIKICMKLEDPLETWDFFHKTAGESYVTKVDSFQTNAGSLLNNYMDSRSASSEKRERVNLLDLKDQREGEAHIFFKSRIVRAKMFYADPKPAPNMRLNHFLKVDIPLNRVLYDLEERLLRFEKVLAADAEVFESPKDDTDTLSIIAEAMQNPSITNPIERALQALLAYQHRHEVGAEPEHQEIDETLAEGHLNIFSKVQLETSLKNTIGDRNWDLFSAPLLNRSVTKDKVIYAERLLGRTSAELVTMMNDLLKDLSIATDYPPEVEGILMPVTEVTNMTNVLVDYIKSLKEKNADDDDV